MRRLLIEEPVSRAAPLSRRVGFFAWLAVLVVLALARFGKLQPFETLAAVLACEALAVVAVLLAILAFVAIWRRGARGMTSALTGLALGSALIAYPAALTAHDILAPGALDITTDVSDPPRPLDAIAGLSAGAPPRAASTTDAGLAKAIPPVLLDQPINDALALALRAAGASSWQVSSVEYPRPPTRDRARFAAVAPSLLIRWPSDAIVRLLKSEEGVRVDVRMVARAPWSLLRGSDGDISAYLDRLEALALGKPPHAGR